MAETEKTLNVNTTSPAPDKDQRTAPKQRELEGSGSLPTSPGINAFYPGFAYPPPVPHNGLACHPGVGPFVPLTAQPVHNALYAQTSGVPYGGMLYPTHSYDFSLALAALAVGEARALLQSTQELRTLTSTSTIAPTSPHEETPRAEEKSAMKQGTWRKATPIPKSRSDVATWRKDAATPIARSSTVPPSDTSLTFLDRFKRSRGNGYTLTDVKGNVALLGLDQVGSRWLQRQLDDAGLSGTRLIVGEVLGNALLLSRDVFGNYVVQKTMEHGDQENKDAIGCAVKGRMRRLSFDVYGCRVAQRLMEYTSTKLAAELARELEDVVMRCAVDSNASHVVQKCVECIPSGQIDFLLTPLCGKVKALGASPAGCRIVQRVIEYCSLREVRDEVLDEVIDNITELATSEYGNYVVQHVAQHGGPEYRSKALRRVGTNFRLFSHHRFASRVVECFLTHADPSERRYMIQSMFAFGGDQFMEESWVLDMMQDPFANYIVQKILEVAEEDVRSMFVEVIKENSSTLMQISHGRSVVDAAINMSLLTAKDVRENATG